MGPVVSSIKLPLMMVSCCLLYMDSFGVKVMVLSPSNQLGDMGRVAADLVYF